MARETLIMNIPKFLGRIAFRLNGGVIHLRPSGKIKGRVLFSYVTHPFLTNGPWNSHTSYWEGHTMVKTFLERGYAVDVIDSTNQTFIPSTRYEFFIDNNINMERLAPLLNPDCFKILHITNAHPNFQNEAAKKRAEALEKRKSASLAPDRNIPLTHGIEIADIAVALGNQFTIDTYAFSGKTIIRVPISSTHTFPNPEEKNFERARKNFVWIGGAGLLHKGLDLVLEAFTEMPEYTLTICGKIQPSDALAKIYKRELYQTPNIKTLGFIDPGSSQFKEVYSNSLGVISASCSEGGGGSVILAMHAGLIPIVNYETSVDVEDFGVLISNSTIEEIKKAVLSLASAPTKELQWRTMSAWKYAREHHTRDLFEKQYGTFIDSIIKKGTT